MLRITLKWLNGFVKVIQIFFSKTRRTAWMILQITIVFDFLLVKIFCWENFSDVVKFFWCRKNCYFALRIFEAVNLRMLRIFLLLWEFFYYCENFSFAVRIFLPLSEFSYCRNNFSFVVRIFLLRAKMFVKLYHLHCIHCCNQDSQIIRRID